MTPAPDEGERLAGENRLKVLLGCTKGIVFELDQDARYVGVWTHDERLLARPRNELLGRTIAEVLGPEYGAQFAGMIRRVCDTGKPEMLEYELETPAGQYWFVADIVDAPQVPGRERTVVCLVRDITAHKLLEDQLRQAQKLDAIGRLAGGIAHDFNNILTTIIGYSEMLLAGLDDDTAHHTQAKRIRHAAGRASALTHQLLAYGRRQVLMPQDLDVNAVITSMADMLRRLIGEHVELHLELGHDTGGAKVDRSGLEQVIMNLSINARDAVGTGGQLILHTDRVELDDVFCASREIAPGWFVRIVAADNGAGMDEATCARVFDPFFTTKELGKGTGLGLSTVYGIVKQSAGHIEVESAPGQGSRFSIYLPYTVPQPIVPAPEMPRIQRPIGSPTVLVAEDDKGVRTLIHRYLKRSGYDVVLASSGDEAVEAAKGRAIDLLVTDMVMPGISGDRLAIQLREELPNLGILYISGYPDAAEVALLDHSLFLRKPFTRQDLVSRLEALLAPADDPRHHHASTGDFGGMLEEAD